MIKVVIADDNMKLAQGCRSTIEKHFPELNVEKVFFDGLSLMNYLNEEIPDILITDIMMPGYNGLEACKRIREVSSTAQIIIITGYEKFSYAQQAISYHVSELISKPFDNKVLVEAIAKAINAPVIPFITYLCDAIYKLAVPDFLKIYDRQLKNFTENQLLFLLENVKTQLRMDCALNLLPLSDAPKCLLQFANQYYAKNSHFSITVQARQFIEDHFQDVNLSRTMVADHLNINTAYLSTVFKKDCGISLNSYITQIRIEHAKKLLSETNYSVQKIALCTGFNSDKYFSQIFKDYVGMTPTQYKR